MSENLIKPAVVAARIGKTVGTLAVWRSTRRYDLPFVKIGSSIMYRESDVEAFIQAGRVEPRPKPPSKAAGKPSRLARSKRFRSPRAA